MIIPLKKVTDHRKYSYLTGVLCMATSEPLPQRPMRKSQRLRGQELQQATPQKVVGSTTTPLPTSLIIAIIVAFPHPLSCCI